MAEIPAADIEESSPIVREPEEVRSCAQADTRVDPEERARREILALEYARTAFKAEHDRFEWAEAKIGRYLTTLTVVLGAAAIGIPDLAVVVGGSKGASEWVFLVAYGLTFLFGLIAMLAALWALRPHSTPTFPAEGTMVDILERTPSSDATIGLARRYLEATESLRTTNAARFRWAEVAIGCLASGLLTAVVSVGMFVWLETIGASHGQSTRSGVTTATTASSPIETQSDSRVSTSEGKRPSAEAKNGEEVMADSAKPAAEPPTQPPKNPIPQFETVKKGEGTPSQRPAVPREKR